MIKKLDMTPSANSMKVYLIYRKVYYLLRLFFIANCDGMKYFSNKYELSF